MGTKYSITDKFGANLADLLSNKIIKVEPQFDKSLFVMKVKEKCIGLTYTKRVELIADELHDFLPSDYTKSIKILLSILGQENQNETGMFTNFYWILPIAKYIEKYGLGNYDISISAIEEVTKRNTGEYAIRPYIRRYPEKTIAVMKIWTQSSNFHLRRLATEGLRPKLPWATKLDTFIDNYKPVFCLLELLKEDSVKFVQKSVANHLTDYLKVNPKPTVELINGWKKTANKNTHWIIKHATRKISTYA